MQPLFLCLALLGVERAARLDRWGVSSALPVSAALGGVTYVYAGGRLLVCSWLRRSPSSGSAAGGGVLVAWAGFAVTQLPLLAYTRAHPGALTRRWDATTFVTDDMPVWEVAWRAAVNYVQDLQVWHYVASGDVKPYAHTPGSGGPARRFARLRRRLVLVLARRRDDPFWRYAVAALAVSPILAALTIDRFHAVRLAPFAVMLSSSWPSRRSRRSATRSPTSDGLEPWASASPSWRCSSPSSSTRTRPMAPPYGPVRGRFPRLLDRAWSDGGTVYVDYDDLEPQGLARWYALTRGIDQSRVVRLADGIPPTGRSPLGAPRSVTTRAPGSTSPATTGSRGRRGRVASGTRGAARQSASSPRGRSSGPGSPRTRRSSARGPPPTRPGAPSPSRA